jgi:hypothetical protein
VKRPPGRPPLDARDPSVQFCVSLPSKQFDALCKRARREDVSVAEIVRRDLEKKSKYRGSQLTERNM